MSKDSRSPLYVFLDLRWFEVEYYLLWRYLLVVKPFAGVIFNKHANDFLHQGCRTVTGSLVQNGCPVFGLS